MELIYKISAETGSTASAGVGWLTTGIEVIHIRDCDTYEICIIFEFSFCESDVHLFSYRGSSICILLVVVELEIQGAIDQVLLGKTVKHYV